jgi:hypothetical protein
MDLICTGDWAGKPYPPARTPAARWVCFGRAVWARFGRGGHGFGWVAYRVGKSWHYNRVREIDKKMVGKCFEWVSFFEQSEVFNKSKTSGEPMRVWVIWAIVTCLCCHGCGKSGDSSLEIPPTWALIPQSEGPPNDKMPWFKTNPVTLDSSDIKKYDYCLNTDATGKVIFSNAKQFGASLYMFGPQEENWWSKSNILVYKVDYENSGDAETVYRKLVKEEELNLAELDMIKSEGRIGLGRNSVIMVQFADIDKASFNSFVQKNHLYPIKKD